ncbi:hypothetical protein GCM10028820_17190 [Tessaracoccus terricola]
MSELKWTVLLLGAEVETFVLEAFLACRGSYPYDSDAALAVKECLVSLEQTGWVKVWMSDALDPWVPLPRDPQVSWQTALDEDRVMNAVASDGRCSVFESTDSGIVALRAHLGSRFRG